MKNKSINPGWISIKDFVQKYFPNLDKKQQFRKYDSLRKRKVQSDFKEVYHGILMIKEYEFCVLTHITYKGEDEDEKK